MLKWLVLCVSVKQHVLVMFWHYRFLLSTNIPAIKTHRWVCVCVCTCKCMLLVSTQQIKINIISNRFGLCEPKWNLLSHVRCLLPAFNIGLICHCIDSSWVRSYLHPKLTFDDHSTSFIHRVRSIYVQYINCKRASFWVFRFTTPKSTFSNQFTAAAFPVLFNAMPISDKFAADDFKYLVKF